MNKGLYVDMPEDLYQRVRRFSFEKDISKKQVIINALNYFFQQTIGVRKSEPIKDGELSPQIPQIVNTPITAVSNKNSIPFD